MKPFPKTPKKIVTVTIEEDGTMTYLATDSADIFMDCGETITRRASHVEPYTFWPRVAFHILRRFVTDKSRIAAWTRTWTCLWRVNTAPVGGPILKLKHLPSDCGLDMKNTVWGNDIATWSNRQDAIDAEIKFLNTWFAERGTR